MGGRRCGVIDGMGGRGGGTKAPPGSSAGDWSVTSGGERQRERDRGGGWEEMGKMLRETTLSGRGGVE